jgi:hypothetical protein
MILLSSLIEEFGEVQEELFAVSDCSNALLYKSLLHHCSNVLSAFLQISKPPD